MREVRSIREYSKTTDSLKFIGRRAEKQRTKKRRRKGVSSKHELYLNISSMGEHPYTPSSFFAFNGLRVFSTGGGEGPGGRKERELHRRPEEKRKKKAILWMRDERCNLLKIEEKKEELQKESQEWIILSECQGETPSLGNLFKRREKRLRSTGTPRHRGVYYVWTQSSTSQETSAQQNLLRFYNLLFTTTIHQNETVEDCRKLSYLLVD